MRNVKRLSRRKRKLLKLMGRNRQIFYNLNPLRNPKIYKRINRKFKMKPISSDDRNNIIFEKHKSIFIGGNNGNHQIKNFMFKVFKDKVTKVKHI